MSREISYDGDQIYEKIVDTAECKDLVNEVCTNPSSDQCCDYPHPEYCQHRCQHFTKEDGKTP